MNFMDSFSWYQQQEEERKNRQKANDILLINQQLQSLLHEVQHKINNWKKYDAVANQLEWEHRVTQSSLWRLSWANNFENEQVALAQGLLIVHILKNESLENKRQWEQRVDVLMRRLGNVDWGIYLQYGKLKSRI